MALSIAVIFKSPFFEITLDLAPAKANLYDSLTRVANEITFLMVAPFAQQGLLPEGFLNKGYSRLEDTVVGDDDIFGMSGHAEYL
jgi:hypothetical protein